MQLLLSAELDFRCLLTQITENVPVLTVSEAQRRELAKSLNAVERQIRKGKDQFTRSSYRMFYELDNLLSTSGLQVVEVNDVIGILMIMNEEFASLTRQPARHFGESVNGVIEVDIRAERVNVPIPFGGVHHFPVDIAGLYREWTPKDETVSVKYTFVMLACLRACLKSFLLSVRFDGESLTREVLEMDEVVNVA